MRILVEKEDGKIVEVRRIETVSNEADTLIFFTAYCLKREHLQALEKELTMKIGKKCVILPGNITNVVGV